MSLEERKFISVNLETCDVNTGEVFQISGREEIHKKYYSIRNLNKRIAIMDLFTMQSKICNSSKDIEVFRDLLYSVDKDNNIRINVTKLAKEYDVSRAKLSGIVSKCKKVELFRQIDRGFYKVNPFVFQSKGSSSERIELAQQQWTELEYLK